MLVLYLLKLVNYVILCVLLMLGVQFFAYKMTVASKNSMLKHRNIDFNIVSLKASDCTVR
jgi:hypothetical protein